MSEHVNPRDCPPPPPMILSPSFCLSTRASADSAAHISPHKAQKGLGNRARPRVLSGEPDPLSWPLSLRNCCMPFFASDMTKKYARPQTYDCESKDH